MAHLNRQCIIDWSLADTRAFRELRVLDATPKPACIYWTRLLCQALAIQACELDDIACLLCNIVDLCLDHHAWIACETDLE